MIRESWLTGTGARIRTLSDNLTRALYVSVSHMKNQIGSMCLNFTNKGISVYLESPGKWDVLVVENNVSNRSEERFAGHVIMSSTRARYGLLVQNNDPLEQGNARVATGSGGIALEIRATAIATDTTSELTHRKSKTALGSELESACYVAFRNSQSFKDWLNSCRVQNKYKGLFCNEGEVGHVNYPDGSYENIIDVKGVTEVTIGENQSSHSYINYYTLYDLLYSRRTRDMGLAGYCASVDIPFAVLGVGLTTCNRMYIKMNIANCDVYLIAVSVFGAPVINESVPASKGIRRRNRATRTVAVEEPIAEVEEMVVLDMTPEQEERLDAWREAHVDRCTARGVQPSNNRQKWFNDYIMSLVLQGQSPDELDNSIIEALN
jgi:hypothetical protein